MSKLAESTRCPVCLQFGKMKYEYGLYICLPCDRSFDYASVDYWNKAFEAGRRFQRGGTQPYEDTYGSGLNTYE